MAELRKLEELLRRLDNAKLDLFDLKQAYNGGLYYLEAEKGFNKAIEWLNARKNDVEKLTEAKNSLKLTEGLNGHKH